ncbi:helix-turn-helix domain-containing protein [Streptomyces sp. MUM 178J]|uniref:helix-turn-helix domain-containing protein n=1 Tax=Streptomyces sp. MUM 178J TaxID=2791991 RepID=UPI001F036D53|nr:helix-turn-helix domain-containing protein [Streptomyces sp. MUM 178J]WRQ81314.1 helix-turn-helix domain-containing protein [Streptomyces sp. MUM 178J]
MSKGELGELHTLGLGETEERAYEALLTRRASGAEELAALLGLPRDRLQAVLGRLVEHGFALPPADGDGALPHPTAPDAAIRTLIHRRQAELHLRSAELERLRMSADRLAGRLMSDAPGPPECGVEAVTGPRAIAERSAQLLASAEREAVLLHPPPALDLTGPLARGVTVRVVLDRDELTSPDRVRDLAALVERGLRVRAAGGVPTRLLTVDGRGTLLPPPDDTGPGATALVVRDGLLHSALTPLFEAVWDRATPLSGPCAAPQHDLLALLAAGLKDEAIARRLGVHVHTARRHISRLLHSLDAETRFQAGAKAALRGWLG